MIHTLTRLIISGVCCLVLASCASMLAGGAKGFCQHNPGDGPCVRQAPGNTNHAPPR